MLEVAGRAGGEFAQAAGLGGVTAQGHRHPGHQLALGHQVVFLPGQGQGMARRLTPGHDGHQMHVVRLGDEVPHDGMAALMHGHHAAVALADLVAALFRAHLHPGNGVHQQLLVDLLLAGAGRQDGRLVHHVLQLRAGGVGHALGHVAQIHIRRKRLALAVHLEDGHTAVQVGIVHRHLPVEAAGAQKRGVKNVAAVGGRHDDHAFVDGKAVHFHQQLVQRLLALVVTAAQARAAVTAHRVDFVDKHNGGRGLLGLLKQIAHAACAHTHEHFHKVGAGDGEEGHVGLAGHGLGQQGFARAGRAHQQNALGNAGAQLGVMLGVAQEIDHLLQLFLFLLGTRHIGEGHLVLGGILHPGAAAAEGHHLVVAPRLAAHHEIPQRQEQERNDKQGQEVIPPGNGHRRAVFHGEAQVADGNFLQAFTLSLGFHLTGGFNKVIADGGFKVIGTVREIRRGYPRVFRQSHQTVVADGHPGHLAVFDHFQQLGIFNPLADRGADGAVEHHGDNQKGGQQDHITQPAPGRFLQGRILLQWDSSSIAALFCHYSTPVGKIANGICQPSPP